VEIKDLEIYPWMNFYRTVYIGEYSITLRIVKTPPRISPSVAIQNKEVEEVIKEFNEIFKEEIKD
jgi:hypothetical protein